MQKFVILDANALIHRAFHAVPKTLHTPAGQLSNAVFGFTGLVLSILEQEKPDYLTAAFDRKGPTFRDTLYKEYKATRAKTDDDLIAQFPLIRDILEGLSVPIFEKEGLEADDYLALVTAQLKAAHKDMEFVIITGDKDALQLVSDRISVLTPITGLSKVKRYDRDGVRERMGVWPEQVPDFKGLSGDPSDNLPGVPGIGEKTAAKLLERFGHLENIYEHIEEVEPRRVRELLLTHEDSARVCKQVATLVTEDEDLKVDLDAARAHRLDMNAARAVFQKMGFSGHLARIEKLNKEWGVINEAQGSLF